MGESGSGLGSWQLRPTAGESLPLGPLREGGGSHNPALGLAPGNFWLNRGNLGCSPRCGLNQSTQGLCLKENLYQASPSSCSVKGSQTPPPSSGGTC